MKKKVALLILDGWGCGLKNHGDAVFQARTPFLDALPKRYPHTTLRASGEDVGLPAGQMGNSEVGHMNLGAGRIVYQELGRINQAIVRGDLLTNPVLSDAFEYAKTKRKQVHLIGLLSDGGVHAHIDHLKGLCESARSAGFPSDRLFIHGFLDGRDTDPHGGIGYINEINTFLETSCGTLASLVGRYYAMDRDRRWERIKVAYDLLIHGKGTPTTNLETAVAESYQRGISDEFLEPIVRTDLQGHPLTTIQEGDVVICFNFRTDRGREITTVLTQRDFPELGMFAKNLRYITMTAYDEDFTNVDVIFEKDNIHRTLGEVLADSGKTQVRIAETEKYPHVTFFFSGGREEPFPGEERILIPSPKVATYDLKPEMSAQEIADAICKRLAVGSAIESGAPTSETSSASLPDFICLNFANPDMVGHTGVRDAVVRAMETVDRCTEQVVRACLQAGYSVLILADHGNAEYMINPDGSPNTAHTTNPVPLVILDPDCRSVKPGKLGDIAPTILHLMQIPVPDEMTGDILI